MQRCFNKEKKMHLSPIPIFMERMLMISLCFFFFCYLYSNAYSMQVESNTLGNVKINADDEEDAVLHKICIYDEGCKIFLYIYM